MNGVGRLGRVGVCVVAWVCGGCRLATKQKKRQCKQLPRIEIGDSGPHMEDMAARRGRTERGTPCVGGNIREGKVTGV